MRWGAFIGLLLGLGSVASADAPPGYWEDVEAGLKGKPLKAALHAIIDDHEARSYSALRDELPVLDAPPEGQSGVLLIYRRATVPADTWPNYNREHLWPQSKGAQRVPAKSDAHHIFASDTDVNRRRDNLEFGECEADCSIDPEAPLAESNRAVWEPPEAIKGDIARALFYMAIRYEGVDPGDTHGEPDLELVESGSTIGCRCMGQLADLRRWHLEDDVSADEKRRHEAAFAFQGNRNPFVDHPEWVADVWDHLDDAGGGDPGGGDDGGGDDGGGDDGAGDDGPGDDGPGDDGPGDEDSDDEDSTTPGSETCSTCVEALDLFATLRATNPLGVPVHSQPRGTGDFSRVDDGTTVQVVGSAFEGGWLRIRLPGGDEGWISRRYIADFIE